MAHRPRVELLEDRLTPVTNINVVLGAAGTGSLDTYISPTDGTITAADGDIGGNTLSVGALTAVGANVDISLNAGNAISFADIGTLNLLTAAGHTAAFNAGGLLSFANHSNIVNTAGAGLTFVSTGGALDSAALNSLGGTIRLTANTTLSVTQPVNAAAGLVSLTTGANATGAGTITANSLAVRAVGGINLTTNVTNLDFTNTGTGAVSFGNTGPLTIADVDGIGAAGNAGTTTTLGTTSGGITFAVNTSSAGALTATAGESGTPPATLTVSPNVKVSTTGANASITLRAGDNVVINSNGVSPSVAATGALTLTAGFSDNDGKGALVLGGTLDAGPTATVTLSALENVTLSGPALVLPGRTVNVTSTQGAIVDANDTTPDVNNITAAAITLSAHQGIGSGLNATDPIEVTTPTITANNNLGAGVSGDVRIVNLGGNLTVAGVNAGAGPFSVTARGAGSVLTVGAGGITTSANNAPVVLTADDMTITGAVVAGTGVATLQPLTPTRAIDLGTTALGTTLGLSDSELDQITAGVLRIGNATQTGNITFTQPISAPLGRSTNLSLQTAGTITQNVGATITGPGGVNTLALALQGGAGVNLPLTGNNADLIAGTVSTASAGFTYYEANGLTIGSVDGVNGIHTNFAPIDVETFAANPLNGPITVANTAAANDIDSTGGAVTLVARGVLPLFTLAPSAVIRSGGGNVVVQADDMAIGAGAAINAGIARATLQPFNPNTAIDLGGAAAGTMQLSAAELNAVTAGTLQIGNATAGNIAVVGSISPSGIQVLSLQTSGGLSEAAGATITAPNLAIRAANAVNLDQANDITTGTLAAQVTTGGQTFTFADANGLTVGNVDGLSGVLTNNAGISLTSGSGGSGNLTLNTNVTAGTGPVALTARGSGATLTNNAAVSNAGVNPISLTADRMALQGGTVTAAGGGRVSIAPFSVGRAVDLGSTTDSANALELSRTELSSVSSPGGVLQIGTAATGAIGISAPLSIGVPTLALINGSSITGTGAIAPPLGGSIDLRISSAGPVNLPGSNMVANLAAAISGGGSGFTFNNAGDLTVGNVDGISGITTSNGAIVVTTANGNLTLNNNVLAGAAGVVLTAGGLDKQLSINPLQVSGSLATLTADKIAIGTSPAAAINVGTGPANIVTLAPFTSGRPVNLGTAGDPNGSLNISDAELDTITAGIIRIGSANAGALAITAPITEANSATSLSLLSNSTVTETGTGSISATGLAVQATGGADLTLLGNNVSKLAGITGGTAFKFKNTPDVTVTTVDGVSGITTAGGLVDITVNTAGGTLGLQDPITTAGGNVTLTADDLDIQAAIAAGAGTVALRPLTTSRIITLGGNVFGTVNLSDTELDKVTAALLRIGDPADTANINVAGPITAPATGYTALSLVTQGGIVDATPGEQTDITVPALALTAGTGIGSGNDLNVFVSNLAAKNTTGAIQVTSDSSVTLPAAGIDGVIGVTNNGTGVTALTVNNGGLTVSAPLKGTAGGNVTVTTTGANAAIDVTASGSVAATGGNGNVVLDSSAGTSNSGISITDNPLAAAEVSAVGTGTITIRANDGVALGKNVVVLAGNTVAGGTIRIESNAGDPSGTADVALGDGVQLLTRGDIIINADPDGDGTGGTITSGTGVTLAGPAGTLAKNISLTAATDLALPALAAATSISATSSGGSLRDDGDDTTVLDAPTINLTAKGDIGGATAITVNDVVNNTAAYKGTIDIDQGGLTALTLTQTAPGNLQVRVSGGLFNTSLLAGQVPNGTGKQLALVGAQGLTVNSPLTIPPADNDDLLLVADGTGAALTVTAPVTNAGTGPTSLVAAHGSVFLNAGVVGGATSPVTVRAVDGSITDGTGPGVTDVTGGPVNLRADAGGTINADVKTTALTATTTNADITIRSEAGAGLPIANVNAGTGNVDLTATDSNMTDLNTGDGTPDVVGTLITLTGTLTGKIGATGAPIEIDAATLVATTADKDITITDTAGGVAAGLVTAGSAAGTATVTLGVIGGSLRSLAVDGIPDVIGRTVVLTGTNGGSIGTGPNVPLEIDANSLTATTDLAGPIRVRDTAGGLTVTNAQTAGGPIVLNAVGAAANLTLGQVTVGGANTATLTATGAILGTAGGPADVTAAGLAATAGDGIGTPAVPLETAVATLAAAGGTGGVTITNRGALAVGAVGTQNGITAAGNISLTVPESVPAAAGDNLSVGAGVPLSSSNGSVTLQAGDGLTLPAGAVVAASSSITLTGGFGDDGNGGTVQFLGAANAPSVVVNGGTGPDTITVNPTSTAPTVTINGQDGVDTVQITPKAASAFTLHGGNPIPASAPPPSNLPGDSLDVVLTGVPNPALTGSFIAGSGYAGSWTFGGGVKPIVFDTIESITPTSSLGLTLTNGVTTLTPGTTVTYTLTVTNAGPNIANGAVLSLPLSGLLLNPVFSSTSTGGATGNTATGTGSLNDSLNLPVGGTVVYTITGRVNPAATGSLQVTATLTAPPGSPDLGGVHAATDTDTLTPSADLKVTTALSGNPPAPGGRAVYTITVSNNGPSDAAGVSFTDVLPTSASLNSVVQTSGPLFTLSAPPVGSTGTLTGSIAALPAGATATFTVVLKVIGSPGTPIGNKVTVASATPDPNTSNNSAGVAVSIVESSFRAHLVTGTGVGGGSNVRVFDAQNGGLLMSFNAFEDTFLGGVNVAQGDITGDGVPDIVCGSGVGGGPAIRVYNGVTGDLVRSFFAYEPTFRGGVIVSSGDVNGDGIDDIIAGSGVGGGPVVKVFDGATGNLIRSFLAYEASFRGGVNVAVADINGDGFAEVIAGSGVGGGPAVKEFDGLTGNFIRGFFAYPSTLRGGVHVGAGDIDGDGFDDILTGSGDGGAPNVRVFDSRTTAQKQSFFAFAPTSLSGVSVAAVDADGDGRADIVAGTGSGGVGIVRVYQSPTLNLLMEIQPYDSDFTGGVFVG